MATQLQSRRGTTAQMNAFTGAEGEIAVNTSTDTLHVHDGSTAGGHALAKADGSNIATYAGSFTTISASGTITGNVTGNLTGNVTGNVTGDVTGDLTGSVLTAAQTNITSVGTLSSLAVTGALTVDTDTLVVDATNNRVGINRALPSGLLHMQSSSGTDSALYIQTSATSDDSVIYFGDDGSSSVGRINYSHSDNGFSFWTDGTRRLDIDSSGNLIVGSTNPAPVSNNVVGVSIRNFGEAQMSTNNQGPLYLNRKGTDGALVTLRKENVNVGSIGVEAGDNFYIADAATNTGLNFKGFINPCDSSGASSRDNFDLGHSTQGRLRDIYLGGGVYLGGTAAGNKLDDFEEGAFSTVAAGVNGSGYNPTMRYTKVGCLVNITARILWTGTSNTSGGLKFTLPFDARASADTATGIVFYSGTAVNGGATISAYIAGGFVYFYSTAGGVFDSIKLNEVNGSYDFIFSFTYHTDE